MSVSIKVNLTTNTPKDVAASRLSNYIQRMIQLALMDVEKALESIEENTTSRFEVVLDVTGEITVPPKYIPRNGGMCA